MKTKIKEDLSKILKQALKKAAGIECDAKTLDLSFEIPREEKFGDLSTNIILKLAKEKKMAPRKLAEPVSAELQNIMSQSSLKERVSKVSIEGPGFINFHYSHHEISSVIGEIHELKADFGRPRAPQIKNILGPAGGSFQRRGQDLPGAPTEPGKARQELRLLDGRLVRAVWSAQAGHHYERGDRSDARTLDTRAAMECGDS